MSTFMRGVPGLPFRSALSRGHPRTQYRLLVLPRRGQTGETVVTHDTGPRPSVVSDSVLCMWNFGQWVDTHEIDLSSWRAKHSLPVSTTPSQRERYTDRHPCRRLRTVLLKTPLTPPPAPSLSDRPDTESVDRDTRGLVYFMTTFRGRVSPSFLSLSHP